MRGWYKRNLHGGAACLLVAASLAGCGSPTATPGRTSGRVGPPPLLADADLQREIDEVIDFSAERHLDSQTNAAWQVVHGILAYGPDLKMNVGDQKVSALEYLLNGGQLRGWRLQPGEKGVETIVEPGSSTGQGHEDQWLGYLALLGVPLEQPIQVGSQTFQFRDLLTQAQWDVHDGMEASWTLMATSMYLPAGVTWKAKDGSEWSVERIIDMEVDQELSGSACGGTHRMVGIATALDRHVASGGELTGAWARANDKVQDCLHRARDFQQPSGAFSASFFDRPGTSGDLAQQIQATGHTLEFVVTACNEEDLNSPWVQRAVQYLCKSFRMTRDADVECGYLYHAIRGLKIYRDRRFGPRDTAASTAPEVAKETADGDAERR